MTNNDADQSESSNGARRGAVVNVNVGVLGHVDSGKTHLVRVLSTHLSTAALDKHPQSQQRGMTLDLGFSAFRVPSRVPNGPELQITLVDCPGHASLFKTILGGVHIIDAVLLVVDIQKGLQPQTIECLLLAQLAVAAQIVVVVNKIDLVPEEDRAERIARVEEEIRGFVSQNCTIQSPDAIIVVPVAAAPLHQAEGDGVKAIGITQVVEAIRNSLSVPTRDGAGPLCFAIDHCFAIQGNGTILTGTILSGSIRVNDEIELPALQITKKIKSMQMFKQNVQAATQGDRVALRVNGLDAALVERGVAMTPKSLPFVTQVVVRVQQIPLFRSTCKSGAKIHATIGHTTVVAVATYFRSPTLDAKASFDPTTVYRAVPQVESIAETVQEYEDPEAPAIAAFEGFASLQFEQPVICPPNAIVVCSRFDLDPKKCHCRLAFHGAVEAIVWDNNEDSHSSATARVAPHTLRLGDLKIGNVKERVGVVDKPIQKTPSTPVTEVLARDMFAKDVDWTVYTDTTVLLEQSKRLGKILGPFGKSGKFRVELLASSDHQNIPVPGEKIVLRFIKLVTLRPLRRAASSNGKGGPKAASSAAKANTQKATRSKLLQDDRVLYSEAFTVVEKPVEEKESVGSTAPPPSANSTTETEILTVMRVRGRIERLKGETTSDHRNPFVIVTDLFTDEASASAASGQRVQCLLSASPGAVEVGEIEKPFGKAGKVRVVFKARGGTLGQVGDVIELL